MGSVRDGGTPARRFAWSFDQRPGPLPAADSGLDAGRDRPGRRRAFYASRVSERAPQVVYSASLEEVEAEAQDSLQVNINTADVEELDELPEVGPATAKTIVEYRQTNGMFRSVDELEEIPGIGPATLEKIEPFATV